MASVRGWTCLLPLLLAACGPPLYAPGAYQTALLGRGGQAEVSAHTGFGVHDLQAAYAPADRLMLHAAVSATSPSAGHRHRYGEAGAGYVHAFGGPYRAALLAGFGLGRTGAEGSTVVLRTDPRTGATRLVDLPFEESARLRRVFVQVNAAAADAGHEGGYIVRLVRTALTGYTSDRPSATPDDRPAQLFLEQGLYYRVGYRGLWAELQYGNVGVLGRPVFSYRRHTFSLGLRYRWGL